MFAAELGNLKGSKAFTQVVLFFFFFENLAILFH